MTSLTDALDGLRRQVLSEPSDRGDAGIDLDGAHFHDPDVVRGSDGSVEVVSVQLVEPLTVGQLRDILGPAQRLPRPPDGGPRTVLFRNTLPAAGEIGATVLAEIDADNRIARLVVRADHY